MTATLTVAIVATAAGTWWYRAFAGRRGILAHKSARTLHERIVPRGAGIVFATAFVVGIATLWLTGRVSAATMLSLGVGGLAASAVGLVDDIRGLPAGPKLAVHILLSLWLLTVLYEPVYEPALSGASTITRPALILALVFVPVWLINLYNFIDGIDGMAAGAAVFIAVAALTALWFRGASGDASPALALVLAVVAGFLVFNLPPASVFMGDAGSIFLGYVFAAILLVTVITGQLSVAVWLTILGYYIGDTTTTTICRIVMVRRWYGVHRSHAYQNLARVLRSHGWVTYGVAAYNVLWVLPLVIWSSRSPGRDYAAAALSVAPAVLWTLRFGPPYSKD